MRSLIWKHCIVSTEFNKTLKRHPVQQLQTHLIYGDLMIAAPTQHAVPNLGFSFSAKYNDLGVCWDFVFEESSSFKYCYFSPVTLKQDSAKHVLWSFFVKIVISF